MACGLCCRECGLLPRHDLLTYSQLLREMYGYDEYADEDVLRRKFEDVIMDNRFLCRLPYQLAKVENPLDFITFTVYLSAFGEVFGTYCVESTLYRSEGNITSDRFAMLNSVVGHLQTKDDMKEAVRHFCSQAHWRMTTYPPQLDHPGARVMPKPDPSADRPSHVGVHRPIRGKRLPPPAAMWPDGGGGGDSLPDSTRAGYPSNLCLKVLESRVGVSQSLYEYEKSRRQAEGAAYQAKIARLSDRFQESQESLRLMEAFVKEKNQRIRELEAQLHGTRPASLFHHRAPEFDTVNL